MRVRLGTRSSRLALWQSERVASLLRERGADCDLVPIETRGDDIPDRPLPEIGGEGLFTERIVQALRARGHVVGYMGDGINAAPALRAAAVGISVDGAVDVA